MLEYLRSLPSIRERCQSVFQLGLADKLSYVRLDLGRLPTVVDYCLRIIDRDYAHDLASIPTHGRWRHLDAKGVGRIEQLLEQWRQDQVDKVEQTRRLVELFVVSVVLDAGAGSTWSYHPAEEPGESYTRSEGLAVASYYMFTNGLFSADPGQPCQVDAHVLSQLSVAHIERGFQADQPGNDMTGLEGRAQLLSRLGTCILQDQHAYFAGTHGPPRLGHLVDAILSHRQQDHVDFQVVWEYLLHGFASIWPDRIMIEGESLGDVWPCPALWASLPEPKSVEQSYIPFHKLTQWMAYSILEPLQKVLGLQITGVEQLTVCVSYSLQGLPEYRNGGLFVDLGIIVPISALYEASEMHGTHLRLPVTHPAVVEWRAVTVVLLDRVHAAIAERLGVTTQQLSLGQVLEAATWKAGREIARQRRPDDGGPPISVLSDGTLF